VAADHRDASTARRPRTPGVCNRGLQRTIVDHGLVAIYVEIWNEAFPDEPPPAMG